MNYKKGSFTTVPIKMIEGLDPQTQIVFVHICKYLNEQGFCWPSMNKLAKDCGMSRRTVMRRIDLLVEKGVLQVEKRHREDGSYTSSLYKVVLLDTPSVLQSPGVVSESHQGSVRESQHELYQLTKSNLTIENKQKKQEKDGQTIQLEDGTVAIRRFGQWVDAYSHATLQHPYTEEIRNHYA